MPSKTWFLPPDFTFLPDGQIALGNVIADPRRPTATLASLAAHPTIPLPSAQSIIEKNRSFTTEKNRSFGLRLLASLLDLAGAHGQTDLSRYKSRTFGAADHEVRAFNGPISREALEAIVALDGVRQHIRSGRFGPRPVYLITGLRVARQSFTVADERGRKTAVAVGGSGPVPAGPVPLGLGADVSGSREHRRVDVYETAPGIVFAYRLHVIRPKWAGAEAELFSDRTAFFSGGPEDDEEEALEAVEVNAAVLREDLDLDLDGYEERLIEEGDDESFVVFGPEDSLAAPASRL
ncbi:d1afdc46-5b84-45ee-8524-b71adaf3b688 [Thermothielavioides terrestris]|uniref:D1afdc46-5b84-45ee-8524-b71adaf3b688 n=1 Tax=Thermothielavioides terrestris TaxID=2587410 RepID=A0A446BXB7_9PEZI|nr:d1afdc46-5b84-45ee-8524-b71adaf3b688 [Thermothielavioides terrestris]